LQLTPKQLTTSIGDRKIGNYSGSIRDLWKFKEIMCTSEEDQTRSQNSIKLLITTILVLWSIWFGFPFK